MNSSSPKRQNTIIDNGSYAGADGHPVLNSSTTLPSLEGQKPCKRLVRYKECLKNHAASIGGNATDGCGEFMQSGEEGTIEALKCLACNCHRNFHRKEIECEAHDFGCYLSHQVLNSAGTTLVFGHNHNRLVGAELQTHQQVRVSGKGGSVRSESDEKEFDGTEIVARPAQKIMRKRFRTKFTAQQKEKMLNFAEMAGWSIQKLEESVVQQFCQEIGIKRRVLKVWMHNNKHTFYKRNSLS